MTDILAPVRLTRETATPGAPVPPARIVHLGLGAFHRAHQAWYTARAADAADWGIAAFTGRSTDLADRLSPQGGLYTVVERGADGDHFEVVPSIVTVAAGDDLAAFVRALIDPQVVILTLTITEAGYRFDRDGLLDTDDLDVQHDIALLRGGPVSDPRPITALGRIVLGLDARRRAGAPPLAIVPCDNIPANGRLVEAALRAFAERVDPGLAEWLPHGIRVVSTSVDRITPRITDADIEAVRDATGWIDEAPVVTEPFADWVLSGEFPSGRPDWESAGARFVDDVEPWEHRKLWMLNGAHTLLALLGAARRHSVVSEAITDPTVLASVERLWDEDARHLPDLDLGAYRTALLERFRNPRIEHRLQQIAEDSLTKLRLRIVPVALRERAAGRSASGCATVVASWLVSIAIGQSPRPDTRGHGAVDPSILVGVLDERLGTDRGFCHEVERAYRSLAASSAETHPSRMEHR